MPILKREPNHYPEDIFELDAAERPWQVAHVKSRSEKLLARHLLEHSTPYFVPQVRKVTRRSGRNFTSHLPLIPGYVFFRGGREASTLARKSGVIVQLLRVDDQARLNEELAQIRDLLQRGVTFEVQPHFTPGQPVVVKEGPFAGYRGIVIQEGRRSRLLVTITIVKKQMSIEFESSVLGPDRGGANRGVRPRS